MVQAITAVLDRRAPTTCLPWATIAIRDSLVTRIMQASPSKCYGEAGSSEFDMQRSEGNLGWLGNQDLTYSGYWSNGVNQNLPYQRCASCAQLPNANSTPATISGTTFLIDNGATAALYTYTPYTGQSFPGIFESWFGSVLFPDIPMGNFELVQQQPGAIRVAGWGLDPSEWTNPASIHVYVDGNLIGALTANTSRPDIGAAYPSFGPNHGFDGTLPYSTPGTHNVCLWSLATAMAPLTTG